MKTIAQVFPLLVAACGSTSPLDEPCVHPDGVFMMTATRTSGTCGEGFATPEPVEFHGWAARLHGVSCSDAPTPFTIDACNHAEWSLTCPDPETMFSGELHCVTPTCDVIEGTEHVRVPGVCTGAIVFRGRRAVAP